ncbi:unnamed protein product [Parascedosporium putredinis]|uniref:Mitochondrial carrier protein n=1 Tax=Parascedosporium putredinis TaxID=1442378 RepID=A0A9P1GVF2_9PEZI|nr:unnamed protein product [Parascedosporium putredinis]CAI7987749.1 unnamed protein product [Parascedosporium putredinis]
MPFASQLSNSSSTVPDSNLDPTSVSRPAISGAQVGNALTLTDDHAAAARSLQDISFGAPSTSYNMTADLDVDSEGRPPYRHAMLAGGIGGCTGDLLMHSLDTVKTRQQGDPHIPPKYTSLDHGVQQHVSYLSAGFLGDLGASIVYVPSEVLKTRLQLQGRYDNPYFNSGYNYRGTIDAARTIVRNEGFSALFYGYKATLYRDLPFSALQFMFWEQFHAWARQYKQSRDIGVPLELLTGGVAGGLAGVITCPLDVVKTRLQTQINYNIPEQPPIPMQGFTPIIKSAPSLPRHHPRIPPTWRNQSPNLISLPGTPPDLSGGRYWGWFRGVGPRGVWTFIQSGCMLFLYQRLLRQLQVWDPVEEVEL